METLSFLRLPSAAQEDLRRKAVQAVLDGGEVTHTAKLFGVSRQALHKWVRLYHEKGEAALSAGKKGAPKTGGKLKPWQCAQTVRTISDKCPEQLKLPGFWLWTREAVQHYITEHFGVALSLSSVGRYLRRWGLSGLPDIAITTYRDGDKADIGHRMSLKKLGFIEAEPLTEFGYPTQKFILKHSHHWRRKR